MRNSECDYKGKKGFRFFKFVGFVILGALGAGVIAVLFGYFVMLLWNWLMPVLFGFIAINFWQAVGIVLLARLIFGGFKHKHACNSHNHHKNKFHEKFAGKLGSKCRTKWMNKEEGGKWKHYDEFWEEEGEKAFDDYMEKKSDKTNDV